MILHIINKSAFQHSSLEDALPYLDEESCLLLIDDGVYCTLPNTKPIAAIKKTGCRSVVLEHDVAVRGISVDPYTGLISMKDFVELAFTAEKTVSWY